MDTAPELLNRLFAAKAARRSELARADFAEKVRLLVKLQHLAAAAAQTRGQQLKPWILQPSGRYGSRNR